MGTELINNLMSDATGRVFPGAQILIFKGREILYEGCWGTEIRPGTAFDLASLTKPLCTVSLVAMLIDRGLLTLTTRVGDILPAARGLPVGTIELNALLNHSSGLQAWHPWGEDLIRAHSIAIAGTKEAQHLVFHELLAQTLDSPPVYSDLGFILLGAMLEELFHDSLDRIFDLEIAKKLNTGLFFVPVLRGLPLNPVNRPIAPARRSSLRGLIRGVVDDDNAFVLGGCAGHAGLFGNARDIHRVLSAWLDSFNGHGFISQSLTRVFWSYENRAGSFVYGFDTPTSGASSAGTRYPQGLVGHLGFTGTSFWLHPETGLGVILLTNRVHPDAENIEIRSFRPILHDLVWKNFGQGR